MDHAISKALEGKKKKTPTHTHSVKYTRGHNGGHIAHVEKHHGKGPHSEGHSHTEEHVIPDNEAAQAHFDEHMGDQPAAGEMEAPQPAAEPEAAQGAAPNPAEGM